MIDKFTFMPKKASSEKTRTFILASFLSFCAIGNAQLSKNQHQDTNHAQNKTLQVIDANTTMRQMSANETPISVLKGKTEDVKKRDLYSKHFKNGDGSYTAVIGSGPIHYLKNGSYRDIDPKITVNTAANAQLFPYANKANLMETYFGATANAGIISHSKEGNIKEFTNNKMYWEVNGQAVGITAAAATPITIDHNKALYSNIFNTIDAEFSVLSGVRKLNYVLKNSAAIANRPSGSQYLVFAEDIVIENNWTYAVNQRGILLSDSHGKPVYRYENPVSLDAKSSGAFTNNTIYEVKQNGNTLTILTKVSTAWLTNQERTFPILVDPSSVYYPNNADDASGQCFATGGGSGDIYAGYEGGFYRGWVTFNTTGLPACEVSSATVSLHPGYIAGTFNTTNAIMLGQSKFDLSSLYFFPLYDGLYTAITDNPTNTLGAYAQITGGTVGTYTNVELGPFGRADVAAKAGGANSFFSLSLSSSWATGTTSRIMGFFGYADAARRPYLTVEYTQTENYCHPTNIYANCAGYGDCEYVGISNVTLGTINNTTLYNNAPTGYTSYTAQTTDLIGGNSYTLATTYKDNGPVVNSGNISAWIDWNQDGSATADEFLGNSGTMTNNQTFEFNFTVPTNAVSGTTRLRVRSALTEEGLLSATSFCNTLEYGETEDYSLNVIVGPINDDCAGATDLMIGESFDEFDISGTNVNTTNSSGPMPACGDYQGNDVWYKITVPADGKVTLETRAEAGSAITATGLTAYTGDCDLLTVLACDDTSGEGDFSLINLTDRTQGETIYVRTWAKSNTAAGTFLISAWNTLLKTANFSASSIGMSPNPAHNELTIKTDSSLNAVAIYNLLGQLVQNGKSKVVNVSGLPNGVYTVQVTMENGSVAAAKFIKN